MQASLVQKFENNKEIKITNLRMLSFKYTKSKCILNNIKKISRN